MKRVVVFAIITAGLLGIGVVLATSESAAEPILGEESLSLPPPSTQKQDVTDALSLFKAHDFEGALKMWKEAAEKNADMPPAQVIMAQLFFQSNMIKEGQSALEQAAVDEPADPETYLLMASVAMHERDVSKAESLIQKAKELLAKFTKSVKRKERLQLQVLSGLAGVAEARGDWAGAQKALEEWLKLDAKNVGLMQRIAYCLLQQKNTEGALAKLREAAKVNAKLLPPETILAQFYQRSGDVENTNKWMAAALAAAPRDIRTRLAASQWALDRGKLDEATLQAVAAARIDPNSFDTKVLQGTIAVFERNYLAAELFFNSALQQAPNNLAVSNNLALVLIEQKEEQKNRRALDLAEANMKKFPKSPEVASTYGLVLYRLGRVEDAEKALKVAAPIVGTDLDTAFVFALMAANRGHKDEARQLLETGLKNVKAAMFRQDAKEMLEELKK